MESKIKDLLLKTAPIADERAVITGKNYRFIVLTSQMIRMEYCEEGIFTDSATRTVINRNFPVPEYRVVDTESQLEIITDCIHMVYNKKKFSKNGLSVQLRGNISAYRSIWHYGEQFENLKGTARTLDEADGAIPLEDGLLSRNGFSLIDDSKSIVITEDGWVAPREKEIIDLYFLGYGREYLKCLKDFYHLCGETPMLPRYAYGNWWSRFHRYDEKEYKSLVNRFDAEKIPFSVAVIDMDWHLTDDDMDPKYGSGWTGYTWNRKLFPQPEAFMDWLHKKDMHVTLNVHPADGVRAHEEMYFEMAKELGVDSEKEDKIQFDISDPRFLEAYFKYLHHPNEEMGVDFWWVDWQQGENTKIEGLEPLWMLNHYHYLDNGRKGKRSITFSRYAGFGSHRYPAGFSGDALTTWETLDFQPYFTATASNAGYGFWSHDIGGHMHGMKSDEMLVRWIQFGVFSPIMRIHSSDNPFFVKEPWKFNPFIGGIMKCFFRLRHQLVPYLYTMGYRFTKLGEPLIQPMYYRNPEEEEAYFVPNEYYFGTELIACPITKPMDKNVNMGVFKGWLPEGIYYDFFSGRRYLGNRRMDFYRDIADIPVFAKAGAIVPLVKEEEVQNSTQNPNDLEVRIFAGADGRFELFEDNSLNVQEADIRAVITEFRWEWGKDSRLVVVRNSDNSDPFDTIPDFRNYSFRFVGLTDTEHIKAAVNGEPVFVEKAYVDSDHVLGIEVNQIDTRKELSIEIGSVSMIEENNINEQVFNMLDQAQIDYDLKNIIFTIVSKHQVKDRILSELQTLHLEKHLMGALVEIITA